MAWNRLQYKDGKGLVKKSRTNATKKTGEQKRRSKIKSFFLPIPAPPTLRAPAIPPRTVEGLGTAPARPPRQTGLGLRSGKSSAHSVVTRALSEVREVPDAVAVTVHFDDGKSENGNGASNV